MLASKEAAPETQATPSEVSSTTDALAQLRLQRHESASKSSDSRPTLQQLELEAASHDHEQEEVIEAKIGKAGKCYFHSNSFSSIAIRNVFRPNNSRVD